MNESRGSEQERELRETQSRIRESLSGIYNQLTIAPVDLPHRNTLRGILAASIHLIQDPDSEVNPVDDFRQRIEALVQDLVNDHR
jgi:hypothetical protein